MPVAGSESVILPRPLSLGLAPPLTWRGSKESGPKSNIPEVWHTLLTGNVVNLIKTLILTDLTVMESDPLTYTLPAPDLGGTRPFEEVLSQRRSRRSFSDEAVSAEEISQILWAANGISETPKGLLKGKGLRTAPSAGATYPLEVYLLAGNITGIDQGVYRYRPSGHSLIRVIGSDIKSGLAAAALYQDMIGTAPACLFFSAVYSRSTVAYGQRGAERYVCMDLGHSAQNVYLQAEALHLGTCAIGAFNDLAVRRIMQLPEHETPMYIMPIGRYY